MSGSGFTTDRRNVLALSAGALALPYALEGKAKSMPGREPDAGLGIGRDQPFNEGWRFRRAMGMRFEDKELDDNAWRSVDLPHDWSIEDLGPEDGVDSVGPFTKSAEGGNAPGFTLGGEGWYRKRFRMSDLGQNARAELLFDGVYAECDVWLNGQRLARHLHGYAPFFVDLTPYLASGENVIALRVRNIGENSRWYAGSGIYREVRLNIIPSGTRIARWGVAGWTKRIEGGSALVEVATRIEAAEPNCAVIARLRDAEGRIVAEESAPAATDTTHTLTVRGPRLWSPDDPYLHRLEVEISRGGKTVDRMAHDFGIRIITIDTAQGLAVNGKRTILRGGCIHHDNGLLGACAYADADERRIRLLRARGYNAIRSSHNPASRTLLAACDRAGMLMIDEAFDMWQTPKSPDDYSQHFRADWKNPLTAMVLSARNNPSVIMWSIGNEVPDRATAEGIEFSWKLADTIRRLDPTRPVTAGLHGLLGPLLKVDADTARPGYSGEADNAGTIFLDVAGYNYRLDKVEAEHAAHPRRIIYGSETFSKDAYDYQQFAMRAPYMLGEFLWTAMDYLGEAGLGGTIQGAIGSDPTVTTWPYVVSWCGDIDLIGDAKASSRYRDVVWGISPLEVLVQRPIAAGMHEFSLSWSWHDELQSWNWPGHEGKAMTVRIYTAGDRVKLLLNGAVVDEKALTAADKMRAELTVPYAAGALEAVAYSHGEEIARRQLETVGPAAKLRLRPERLRGGKGKLDLQYIPIDVLDASGRLLPEEARKITLSIDGPAVLAGFGSANPRAVGSFQKTEAQSFRGRALAILRGTGREGTVTITAESPGIAGASARLDLA